AAILPGVTGLSVELVPKRLELLHWLNLRALHRMISDFLVSCLSCLTCLNHPFDNLALRGDIRIDGPARDYVRTPTVSPSRTKRQHVRDGLIHVRQSKTGTTLAIPLHPELCKMNHELGNQSNLEVRN